VRDVALVPQGHVLEGCLGVAADHASQTGDTLGDHRVPLVGHRGRALLPFRERLLDLADLGSREVADLRGDLVEGGRRDGESGHVLRVAVALDHLGRRLDAAQTQTRADELLHPRVHGRVGAHRAADRAHRDDLAGATEPVAVAIELEGPDRELVPEAGRLGQDAV
jgi:hypothetical protein